MNYRVETIENPELELIQFFDQKIEEFNIERWEVKKKVPLAIRITNDNDLLIGGGSAKTFGSWLLIENVWISEELRGQKVGSQIISDLEETARKRGCKYSLLDTLNFQARPFYEKLGYQVQWTQEEYPKDGCKYFMVKKLI